MKRVAHQALCAGCVILFVTAFALAAEQVRPGRSLPSAEQLPLVFIIPPVENISFM